MDQFTATLGITEKYLTVSVKSKQHKNIPVAHIRKDIITEILGNGSAGDMDICNGIIIKVFSVGRAYGINFALLFTSPASEDPSCTDITGFWIWFNARSSLLDALLKDGKPRKIKSV